MNKQRRQIIERNEVSGIYEVELGGHLQKIMIDGKRKDNPVVLCLHGGPGTPIPFNEGCRGMFPEMTEQVTLVCWDQLGCGINNKNINDTYQIHDFITMTEDLIWDIRHRFPGNPIIVFGMSWGSVLILKALHNIGNYVDNVITYGQVLHDIPFNDEVFSSLEQSAMPENKKKRLDRIKEERTIENARLLMSWVRTYTSGYAGSASEKVSMGSMIKGYFTGPDYRLRDSMAIIINGYLKNKSLLQELLTVDLREDLETVSVPYTIIQGSLDIVTPTKYIQDFLEENKNENIRLEVVEMNGHIPNSRGMEQILKEIINTSTSRV